MTATLEQTATTLGKMLATTPKLGLTTEWPTLPVIRRTATVSVVNNDVAPPTVDIVTAGGTTIPGLPILSSYDATAGDTVLIDVVGTSWTIIGTTGSANGANDLAAAPGASTLTGPNSTPPGAGQSTTAVTTPLYDTSAPGMPAPTIMVGLQQISVTWAPVLTAAGSEVASYTVTLATNQAMTTDVQVQNVTGPVAAFTGLTSATTYWIVVQAASYAGNTGSSSAPISATTPQAISTDLGIDSVTSAQIATAAVTAIALANASVTSSAISAGGVDAAALAASAVTEAALAAGAVTATAISAGAVGAEAIAAGAISAASIQAGAIGATALAAGSVTANAIAALAVTANALAANSIMAGSAVIGTAAIASAQIASLSADLITAGTIQSQTITLGAQDTVAAIQSATQATGQGWEILGDGYATFTGCTITGNIMANELIIPAADQNDQFNGTTPENAIWMGPETNVNYSWLIFEDGDYNLIFQSGADTSNSALFNASVHATELIIENAIHGYGGQGNPPTLDATYDGAGNTLSFAWDGDNEYVVIVINGSTIRHIVTAGAPN